MSFLRSHPALWVILLLGFFFPAVLAAATEAENRADAAGSLLFSSWSGSALGESRQGYLCFIQDQQSNLRGEIMVCPPARWQALPPEATIHQLLDQTGEGYTLILTPENVGTLNPWREKWDRLDPSLGLWVRVLACGMGGDFDPGNGVVVLDDPGKLSEGMPRFLGRTRESQGAVHRFQLGGWSAAGPETGQREGRPAFRGRMTRRGSGRGGSEEILQILESEGGGSRPGFLVTSSRKPGHLFLGSPRRFTSESPGREVFVPLWPLGDLLSLDSEIFGNSAAGER